MTSYHIAQSLQIIHDYWGDEVPPFRVIPHNPNTLSRQGLLPKPGAGRLDIVAETSALTEQQIVTVDVLIDDQSIATITDGTDGAMTPHLDLTDQSEDFDISLSDVRKRTDAPRVPGDPFMRIDLAVPSTGTCKGTLRLSTIAALWAYHITGNKVGDPLQIIDNEKEYAFEDLGQSALPDGAVARVFRSTAPVALRHRSQARFTLEARQDPPFDPITLIPVLPAAGINLRPTTDPAAATPLQSDIFVSLW